MCLFCVEWTTYLERYTTAGRMSFQHKYFKDWADLARKEYTGVKIINENLQSFQSEYCRPHGDYICVKTLKSIYAKLGFEWDEYAINLHYPTLRAEAEADEVL